MHICSPEKKTDALIFSKERKWYFTKITGKTVIKVDAISFCEILKTFWLWPSAEKLSVLLVL